jgi:hypothetical protein
VFGYHQWVRQSAGQCLCRFPFFLQAHRHRASVQSVLLLYWRPPFLLQAQRVDFRLAVALSCSLGWNPAHRASAWLGSFCFGFSHLRSLFVKQIRFLILCGSLLMEVDLILNHRIKGSSFFLFIMTFLWWFHFHVRKLFGEVFVRL